MERLVINRSLLSKRITQGWGENKACTVKATGRIIGTKNGVCPAGSEPFYKTLGMKGHNGLDIALIRGEKIVHGATYDGWMKTEVDYSGGIGVDIISDKPLFFFEEQVPDDMKPFMEPATSHGKLGYKCHVKERHWHLKAAVGFDGKKVKHGQVIGLGGSTGASSGPHLHLGYKFCDKDGNTFNKGNGYFGAFDFTPFYNHDIYAVDAVVELNGEAPQLSDQERKEIKGLLSKALRLVLILRELILAKNANRH